MTSPLHGYLGIVYLCFCLARVKHPKPICWDPAFHVEYFNDLGHHCGHCDGFAEFWGLPVHSDEEAVGTIAAYLNARGAV